MQHCGCCIILWSIGQVCATMLHPGMHNSSIFNTQHVVTRCNRVAKRTQHVTPNNVAICCIAICWPESANAGPTMMGYVVLKCCYRLAGTWDKTELHQGFSCTWSWRSWRSQIFCRKFATAFTTRPKPVKDTNTIEFKVMPSATADVIRHSFACHNIAKQVFFFESCGTPFGSVMFLVLVDIKKCQHFNRAFWVASMWLKSKIFCRAAAAISISAAINFFCKRSTSSLYLCQIPLT